MGGSHRLLGAGLGKDRRAGAGLAVDLGRARVAGALKGRGGIHLRIGNRRGVAADVQHRAQEVLVHGVDERAEGGIGLLLVLDERVALAKAAQADAGLEVVHLLQVGHPAGVDDAQHHLGGETLGNLGAEVVGALGVQVAHVLVGGGHDLGGVGLVGNLGHAVVAGELLEPGTQTVEVPVLHGRALGAELAHLALDGGARDLAHVLGQVLAVEDLVALLVDDLALLVHDVVVVEDALTHGVVDLLDLALGALDGLADHASLERHVGRHVGLLHELADAVHAVGAEQTHEVVLERKVELGLARIALTAGTPAELVVDATALMALGADDGQAAGGEHALALLGALLLSGLLGGGNLLGGGDVDGGACGGELLLGQLVGVATEQDVGTTASHVGGDCDGALAAGLGHDLSLTLVELGVQDLVVDAALVEHAGKLLGALDGDGAHQHGLSLGVALGDVRRDGLELVLDAAVDAVVVVDTHDGLVGRNLGDGELVDLAELGVLGHGGARHAGELVVETEVVLQGDGGERLVLLADEHALLGLHGLVQALGPTTALHDAARELVDDLDLAVEDDVVLVAVEHVLGLERLLEVVGELAGEVGVNLGAETLLDGAQALLGGRDGVLGLVHDVIAVGLGHRAAQRVALGLLAAGEAADGTRELLVGVGRLSTGAGDDQRRTGLVDEDGVDLVDDGEAVAALHAHVGAGHHVVAQVVEAELGVGAIGDVGGVGRPLVGERHAVLQQAHAHAEELVELAHPLGVTASEVVVDRDDVDALAGDGVEVARERGDEGLALARLHLGDGATVQGDAADDLHVEVTHAKHAVRGLAADGKGLRKQVVERLAVGIALAEDVSLTGKFLVVHRGVGVCELVDLVGNCLVLLQLLVRTNGENL